MTQENRMLKNAVLKALDDLLAERDRLRAVNAELVETLKQCEDLLSELSDGGAENPELEIARAALARAKEG